MTPATGTRPVQLKIAVDDVDEAIAFYQKAFGFHYDVTRRTDEGDYSSFMFSKYGERDFFLIHLLDEAAVDRPGPTTFGLLVDDLDADPLRRPSRPAPPRSSSPRTHRGCRATPR